MLNQNQLKIQPKKRSNSIKIIKGVVFLLLAVLFLFVTFYNIRPEYDGLPFREFYVQQNFNEYFKNTYLNIAFSILFAIIGILELKEGANNGN